MASGVLGQAALAAATDTVLYTCPANTVTTGTVSFCNTGITSVSVRLAVGKGAAPGAADHMAFDVVIPGGGFFERTGVVIGAGEKVFVRTSIANTAACLRGFEDDI